MRTKIVSAKQPFGSAEVVRNFDYAILITLYSKTRNTLSYWNE